MAIQQLSVFAENKPGAIIDITGALAQKDIDIRALSLADTRDYGILRLIVSDTETAKEALVEKGYLVSITPVVGVSISDNAGALSKALAALDKAGINIEYMYAFIGRGAEDAYVILRTTDENAAESVLLADGEKLLDEQTVKSCLR